MKSLAAVAVIWIAIAALWWLTVGVEVAQADARTPKQINQALAAYLGQPGFKLQRGNAPGYQQPIQAYWNPAAKQMHVSRTLYKRLSEGKLDRKTAMALSVLAHEIGHVNQPAGVANASGGLDSTPEWRLDMEGQADTYARENMRKIVSMFFAKPRDQKLMTQYAQKKLTAFRAQNPYRR